MIVYKRLNMILLYLFEMTIRSNECFVKDKSNKEILYGFDFI